MGQVSSSIPFVGGGGQSQQGSDIVDFTSDDYSTTGEMPSEERFMPLDGEDEEKSPRASSAASSSGAKSPRSSSAKSPRASNVRSSKRTGAKPASASSDVIDFTNDSFMSIPTSSSPQQDDDDKDAAFSGRVSSRSSFAAFLPTSAAQALKEAQAEDKKTPSELNITDDGVMRAKRFVEPEALQKSYDPDVTTVWQSFQNSLRQFGNNTLLMSVLDRNGYVHEQSYEDVALRIFNFGSGLVKLGLVRGSVVAFWGRSSAEFFVGWQACSGFGFVCMPIEANLDLEVACSLAREAHAKVFVIDTIDARPLYPKVKTLLPDVEIIVQLKDVTMTQREVVGQTDIPLMSFLEVENIGEDHPCEKDNSPKPDDLAGVFHTSGTTGDPKLVKLKHKTLLAQITSFALSVWLPRVKATDKEIMYPLLFGLPERIAMETMLVTGSAICFPSDTPSKDFSYFHPTFLCAVPSVLKSLYNRIRGDLAEDVFATNINEEFFCRGVREMCGGALKLVVCVGFSLEKVIIKRLCDTLAVPVLSTYALTEAGIVCAATGKEKGSGIAGLPTACCEVRLFDVPAISGLLEICVRGPILFDGYVGRAPSAGYIDGYLRTGDVAMVKRGSICVLDRISNVYRNPAGMLVGMYRLSECYSKSEWVSQVFVDVDKNNKIVTVVVPNLKTIREYADRCMFAFGPEFFGHAKPDDIASVVKMKAVRNRIIESLDSMWREKLHCLMIELNEFTQENNLLTSTFVQKRDNLRALYQINTMEIQ
jgi:long-chain acyl-CoA synthetase